MSTATKPAARRGQPRPLWRRALPYVIGAALLALVVVALWPKPVAVELATVARGPLAVTVFEDGKTRIRHRHVIAAPAGGLLQRVELRAGARIVAGGTVLAVIEAAPLDPRTRAEARAAVSGAEAARSAREEDLQRVRAALELAQRERTRAEELRATGAISTQEWDAADNQARVLARERSAAEFALRVAEFQVEQARAALLGAPDGAAGEGRSLRLVAPVDGVVLQVFEESARVVAPGTPVMEVGDPRDLEAEIELLSSDAVAVAPGADVSIERWGGEAPLRGRVSVVEPAGFTKFSALGVEEQRVKVRVDFVEMPPPGRELGDRYRVEARITTWRGDDVLQVPTGALFRRGSDWVTFVVEGGRAQSRVVEIAHNNGIAAEVVAGLGAGDQVIVHPADRISDGVRVAAGR